MLFWLKMNLTFEVQFTRHHCLSVYSRNNFVLKMLYMASTLSVNWFLFNKTINLVMDSGMWNFHFSENIKLSSIWIEDLKSTVIYWFTKLLRFVWLIAGNLCWRSEGGSHIISSTCPLPYCSRRRWNSAFFDVALHMYSVIIPSSICSISLCSIEWASFLMLHIKFAEFSSSQHCYSVNIR